MSQTNLSVDQRYALLKAEFDEIDKKYNRALNDIELDFPPSLGLAKLTFTPTDQETLASLAQDYFNSDYEQQIAQFTQQNLQKQRVKSDKIRQETTTFDTNCQTLQQKYQAKRLAFVQKAIKNSIVASSIYQQELDRLLAEYNQQVQSAQTAHQQAVDSLNNGLQLLQQLLSQTTQSLQEEKQAKVQEKLFQLNQQEQKRSDSVTKYNNSVDKQEADYQVKIQKAQATVISAEQRRALEAINLLATVGVAGVERLKAEEKVTPATEFFQSLSASEAQRIFYGDDTLQYHFGSYYSYMKELVDNLQE